jgi:hypothetical protein
MGWGISLLTLVIGASGCGADDSPGDQPPAQVAQQVPVERATLTAAPLPEITLVHPASAHVGDWVWVYGTDFADGDVLLFANQHFVPASVAPTRIDFRVPPAAYTDRVAVARNGRVVVESAQPLVIEP